MEMLRLFIFLIFTVTLSIYDMKFLKVPIAILFTQIISLVIFDFLFFRNEMLSNLVGAISCFMVLLLTYFLSRRNLGVGDVEFGLSVGWLLGNWLWIPALFIATILGIVFILLKRKPVQNAKIPFIPVLGFASFCIGIVSDTG